MTKYLCEYLCIYVKNLNVTLKVILFFLVNKNANNMHILFIDLNGKK